MHGPVTVLPTYAFCRNVFSVGDKIQFGRAALIPPSPSAGDETVAGEYLRLNQFLFFTSKNLQ